MHPDQISRTPNRVRTVVLASLVCVIGSLVPAEAEELVYEIFSNGESIGTSTITAKAANQATREAVQVTATTTLRKKAFFVTTYSLDSKEWSVFDDAGLQSYRSRTRENGHDFEMIAVRAGGFATVELSTRTGVEVWRFGVDDFDLTSVEESGVRLDRMDVPKIFRVLDLDRLEIVTRTLVWVRNETLLIGDEAVGCRVIDASGGPSRSRRWVAEDGDATLIQEFGSDEIGPFSVVLKSPWETGR